MPTNTKNTSPATKQDVKNIVLEVLGGFWEQFLLPELQKKADKTDIVQLDIKLSAEINQNRRLIHGLQLDTPTMKEFKTLDKRVTRLENQLLN